MVTMLNGDVAMRTMLRRLDLSIAMCCCTMLHAGRSYREGLIVSRIFATTFTKASGGRQDLDNYSRRNVAELPTIF
jgi:hypothetical protein